MAKANASNYTTTQFAYAQADSDQFDRTDVSTLAQAVDGHTHESGKGIQIPTGGIADDAVTAAKIADGAIDAAAKLGSDVVTTAKILDANVTAAKLASDAVTTVKILDANVTTAKINDSAVTTAKINDSAVTTAKINDGAVTAAKLSGSTVLVTNRQGGSATDWNTAGTNNYVPVSAVIQCGTYQVTVADGNLSVLATITFPAEFGGTPVVVATAEQTDATSILFNGAKANVAVTFADGFSIQVTRRDPSSTSGAQTIDVNWIAVGPPA